MLLFVLLYADDVVIMAEDEIQLQQPIKTPLQNIHQFKTQLPKSNFDSELFNAALNSNDNDLIDAVIQEKRRRGRPKREVEFSNFKNLSDHRPIRITLKKKSEKILYFKGELSLDLNA